MTGIRYDCYYLGKGTLPWATPCLGSSRVFLNGLWWMVVDFSIMTGIRYDCYHLGKGTLPWAIWFFFN